MQAVGGFAGDHIRWGFLEPEPVRVTVTDFLRIRLQPTLHRPWMLDQEGLGVRVLVQDQKAVTNRAGIDNDNGNGLGLGVKAHCSPGFWLRQIGKQGTGTREQGSGFRSQGFQRLY